MEAFDTFFTLQQRNFLDANLNVLIRASLHADADLHHEPRHEGISFVVLGKKLETISPKFEDFTLHEGGWQERVFKTDNDEYTSL